MTSQRDRDGGGRPRQARPRDALGRPLPYGAKGVEPVPEEPLPPLETVALARRLMWTGLGLSHPMEAHRADSRAMFARGQSGDAHEGVTAFLEKRPAEFEDRVSDGLPELFPGQEEPVFR